MEWNEMNALEIFACARRLYCYGYEICCSHFLCSCSQYFRLGWYETEKNAGEWVRKAAAAQTNDYDYDDDNDNDITELNQANATHKWI